MGPSGGILGIMPPLLSISYYCPTLPSAIQSLRLTTLRIGKYERYYTKRRMGATVSRGACPARTGPVKKGLPEAAPFSTLARQQIALFPGW